MDDNGPYYFAAIVICLILSAFFSASETAYSSLNLIRLKARADNGDRKAAKVLKLSEAFDSLLSTILIGNNIVNIGMSSLAPVLFVGLLGSASGPGAATLVITVAVLIFGEITPKSLAKERPEAFAFATAPILSVLVAVFTPLNVLFSLWKKLISHLFHKEDEEADDIIDAELITMVSEAENEGDLTNRESELIRSAIEFDDVEVEEVLTPRVDVEAVADDTPLDEVADVFEKTGYSRLPVYHDTIDNIIGVIHEKDVFKAIRRQGMTMADIIKDTLYTTGSTQISELLRTLREQHHHMAVVVDEYGGTEGIITLEDVLEELVGEIWDEHDEETQDFVRQTNGCWLVKGSAGMADLYEKLGIPEDEDVDAITVGGLVQEMTGHLPRVGDTFLFHDYEATVTRETHRRVEEIRLKKISAERDRDTKKQKDEKSR